jgi:hypothetical protein
MATRPTNLNCEIAGAGLEFARRYSALFVNRLAYTVQSTNQRITGSTITIAQNATGDYPSEPSATTSMDG